VSPDRDDEDAQMPLLPAVEEDVGMTRNRHVLYSITMQRRMR
jgi:hypothetical protein